MFDIGISELGVIAVVALIVIGPERLPRVARTVGTLLGRAQRYVNDVKAEVNREIELEELKKLQVEMQNAAQGIQKEMTAAGSEMQSAVHDMERSLQDGMPGTPGAAPTAAPDASVPSLAEASSAASYPPLQEPPGTPPYNPPQVEANAEAQPSTTAPVPLPTGDPRAAANLAATTHPEPDKPTQASLFS